MARSKFELIYPHDGSRKQIGCAERNSLLLSREIQQIGPQKYKFTGQAKTFRAFADLSQLLPYITLPPNLLRRYLAALCVIWQLQLELERQMEETPEAFAIRLEAMGVERQTPKGQIEQLERMGWKAGAFA